jgi:hypothetical protein
MNPQKKVHTVVAIAHQPNRFQIELLKEVGKLPLGMDGDLSPVFLIPSHIPHALPLAIEMHRQETHEDEKAYERVGPGDVLVIFNAPQITQELVALYHAECVARHTSLLVEQSVHFAQSPEICTFKDFSDLKNAIYARLGKNATKKQSPDTHTTPLRFLQIAACYDDYLTNLYKQKPELANCSFEVQSEYLREDYFSGAHMIAPYMKAYGYDARLIIINCPQSQVAWALEHGHADAIGPDWKKEIIRRQIAYYKPDILYNVDPIEFDSRFLNTVDFRPQLVIGWRASVISPGTD